MCRETESGTWLTSMLWKDVQITCQACKLAVKLPGNIIGSQNASSFEPFSVKTC